MSVEGLSECTDEPKPPEGGWPTVMPQTCDELRALEILHSDWMCEDIQNTVRTKSKRARQFIDCLDSISTFLEQGGNLDDLQGLPLDHELLKYLSLIPSAIGNYLAGNYRERPEKPSKEIESLITGNLHPEHVRQVIGVACATFNRRLVEVAKTFPAEVTTVLFQK